MERLTNLLKTQTATARAAPAGGGSGTMTSGDKGKVVKVEKSFVVIKFEDTAINELLGEDHSGVLPQLEMLLYRKEKGKDKPTVVGRIRLRQWTPNTNFVMADVLPDWLQTPVKEGDVVIPD